MTCRTAALACVIASVAGPLPTGTAAAQGLAVREWQVPWERTRPRDPFVAPDGAIWYVDYARGFLGRLDPVTAAVEEWEVHGFGISDQETGALPTVLNHRWNF